MSQQGDEREHIGTNLSESCFEKFSIGTTKKLWRNTSRKCPSTALKKKRKKKSAAWQVQQVCKMRAHTKVPPLKLPHPERYTTPSLQGELKCGRVEQSLDYTRRQHSNTTSGNKHFSTWASKCVGRQSRSAKKGVKATDAARRVATDSAPQEDLKQQVREKTNYDYGERCSLHISANS